MLDFSRFDAMTFDCYGTLIDWETGILGVLRGFADRHGVRTSDVELLRLYARLEREAEGGAYVTYREVLGRVMDGVALHFGASMGSEERASLADSLAGWEPFPDTVEALRVLAHRYRLVVCSNVDDELFAATRRKLGVEFEWVVTAEYCRSYKPQPRHFRVAMALLGLPASRVLHVAESLYHDVAPARALGMTTVWVNRRAGRGAGPSASGSADAAPDMTVPDMASLARLACR